MIYKEEQFLIKYYRDKASNIAKNPKYDEYQCGLASMIYKFYDKKFSGANTSGGAVTRDHSCTKYINY